MTLSTRLLIDIRSYWHAGTGLSAGTAADAVTEKDHRGLPVIGGRHLKGLLRHAVHSAEQWGWFDDVTVPAGPAGSLTELLFGTAPLEAERTEGHPGMVVVSDAHLRAEEADWLARPEQAALKEAIWHSLAFTAIDDQGIALDHSLRVIEVALPMQLEARLQLSCTALDQDRRAQQAMWLAESNHWAPLSQALALIDAVGAGRNRGLGEAVIRLEQNMGKGCAA